MELQAHIKLQSTDIAPTVLLPGDPARVRRIAEFWDTAKEVMFNREFLTMTGTYKGMPISATSTGIGCPSAAIAVEELANIGAKTLIRIGTCGGLKKEIEPGDLIVPVAAIRAEGTTREYLPPEFPALADPAVVQALTTAAAGREFPVFTGVNRTHDAFYEPVENLIRWGNLYNDQRMQDWNVPLVSSEMECSAVFLISYLRGLRAGAVLAVNTTEPLDEIAKRPELVYELIQSPKAKDGVDRAIQVALDAAVALTSSEEKG